VEDGCKFEYPDGAHFGVCITHDIDLAVQVCREKLKLALKSFSNSDFREGIEKLGQMRSRKLPYCNINSIIKMESEFGATSTFFFLVGSEREEEGYHIQDMAPEMGKIIDAGCEIGLHGGHSSYMDGQDILAKKVALEKVAGRVLKGYRNHYLRFKVPVTWDILSKTGFIYDTTFGYADCLGFRNGMCHPFKPYDRVAEREIDILELPLHIMDRTIDEYMRVDPEEAWPLVKRIVDSVEACNGVLTVLWHNDSLLESANEKLFRKLLGYCQERKAWLTSCARIVEFWKRSYPQ